ncbi:sensor histidine kinase KdpD [Olsenella sp. oral taxon 809]|uniref:sensor histidine kinase n=1 Tax=Olsenella sp. oral taxon 809 TaxID=661086 RepID=UPI0018DC80DF|nr:HAMP domain-containing sensor histidine kinase [Olsenella sp. oral taxon 809]
MRRARWPRAGNMRPALQLALLFAGCVAAALLAVVLAYGQLVQAQMRDSSEQAIDALLGDGYEEGEPSRVAIPLTLTADWELDESDGNPYTPLDRLAASWASEHRDQTGRLVRVERDGLECYLKVQGTIPAPQTEAGLVSDEGAEVLLAYVDVSGEEALAGQVRLLLLGIMLISTFGAAAAGWAQGRQVEARERAVRTFYENVSHELKTPLAAIGGYAEGLREGVIADGRQAGVVILGEVRKMSEDVGQLLDISRLEGGAVMLECERLDLAELVEDCLVPFEGAVASRQLDVSLDLRSARAEVDARQFERAFDNLVTNAIRHARSRLRVFLGNGELVVWNDCARPAARDLDALFDRFRTDAAGGSGIGLALAREAFELHGWRVEARYEDGGLAMRVRLG